MPSPDTKVTIRTSLEAKNIWCNAIESDVTESLRFKKNKQHEQNEFKLFTNKELSSLPYRKQNKPFSSSNEDKENVHIQILKNELRDEENKTKSMKTDINRLLHINYLLARELKHKY